MMSVKRIDRFFDPRSAKTFTRITFRDDLVPVFHFSNGATASPFARPIPFTKEKEYGFEFGDGVFVLDQNEFREKVS